MEDVLCAQALTQVQQQKKPRTFVKFRAMDVARGNLLQLNHERTALNVYHGTKPALASSSLPATYADDSSLNVINTHFERILEPSFAYLVDLIDQKSSNAEERANLYGLCYKRLVGALAFVQSPLCEKSLGQNIANGQIAVKKHSSQTVNWMKSLREQGYKLFVLSDAKLSHLDMVLQIALGNKWKDMFDIVVADAKKSAFFSRESGNVKVMSAEEGLLVQSAAKLSLVPTPRPRIIEGGSLATLQSAMNTSTKGEEKKVVFFGDHLVKDVCNPTLVGWATVGVFSEMDDLAERASKPSLTTLGGDIGCFACFDGTDSLLTAKLVSSAALCLPSVQVAAASQLFLKPNWHPRMAFPYVKQWRA